MTHYAVLVRLPAATPSSPKEVMRAITDLMEPWQEHACTGECPQQFMRFNDLEDEYRQEYETETDTWIDIGAAMADEKTIDTGRGETRVLIHNGRRLVRSFNEMFRVKGSIGIGGGSHEVPKDLKEVEIPFKEIHPTLEDFAVGYHGSRGRDEVTGKFGYWENPNKKWDYWKVIHGAIEKRGAGEVDCSRICDLDGDKIATETRARAEARVSSIVDHRAGRNRMEEGNPEREDFMWKHDARRFCLDAGVLQCVAEMPEDKEDDDAERRQARADGRAKLAALRETHRVVKQHRPGDTMVVYDCWDDRITAEQLTTMALAVCHPLRTWARVDVDDVAARVAAGVVIPTDGSAADFNGALVKGDSRWTEPGRMGWWASHDASPEKLIAHATSFTDWLKAGDQNDLIIMLDCHI